jgi:hypothetical protein
MTICYLLCVILHYKLDVVLSNNFVKNGENPCISMLQIQKNKYQDLVMVIMSCFKNQNKGKTNEINELEYKIDVFVYIKFQHSYVNMNGNIWYM